VAIGLGIGLIIAAAIVFGGLLQYTLLLLPLALPILVVVPIAVINAVDNSLRQRRSHGQLPPRPAQGGQAPEVQQPGQTDQTGHGPALPPDRPGHGDQPSQASAGLRSDRSRPGRTDSSGRGSRAPRSIRPVPDAV
jgi:hypothetical protein